MDEALKKTVDDGGGKISGSLRQSSGSSLGFATSFESALADQGDAEDVLQDVFYELVEAYRLMKPIEQVTAWLYKGSSQSHHGPIPQEETGGTRK